MNKIKDKSCVDSQRNFNNLYISSEINFVRDKEKEKDKEKFVSEKEKCTVNTGLF